MEENAALFGSLRALRPWKVPYGAVICGVMSNGSPEKGSFSRQIQISIFDSAAGRTPRQGCTCLAIFRIDAVIEACTQFFTGFEEWNELLFDLYSFACARVTANARITLTH